MVDQLKGALIVVEFLKEENSDLKHSLKVLKEQHKDLLQAYALMLQELKGETV